jgi:hypothetical protein
LHPRRGNRQQKRRNEPFADRYGGEKHVPSLAAFSIAPTTLPIPPCGDRRARRPRG